MNDLLFFSNFLACNANFIFAELKDSVPWESRTPTRSECFMSDPPGLLYTYGVGRGVRAYTSHPIIPIVQGVMNEVNKTLLSADLPLMNGAFLNRYENEKQHLGWHSDDFVGMDHTAPVCVVSFGEAREIWWRKIGESGLVPSEQRQKLSPGSLFIMPPGFQHTHEHRIPRGDREMTPRISLTFRRFLES